MSPPALLSVPRVAIPPVALNHLALVAWVLGAACVSAQPPPAPVVVAPVIEEEVAAGQTFVGTVQPLKTATIGSAVAGRVLEYSIQVGDRVEEGATLAQLLTATIRLELAAAEAELELRSKELLELENGSLDEEIAQSKARLLGAKAQKEYLESRAKRFEVLSAASAREERENAVAAAATAAAELKAAEAAFQLAEKGPRKEKIAQARARVAAQQAQVDLLNDRIRKYTVVTRFAGYVTAEHTELGEWLKVGDPVAEVAALDQVEVVAQVVENQVPFVQLGMTVRVEIPSLADQVFTGEVVSVAPQGDLRSRTFPVRVQVENVLTKEGPKIKSGMFARVTLPTGAKTMAMLTPKDAIVLGGPRPMVPHSAA